MSQQLTVTGMVLTSMPVGDYDKRITILTKERGKITAFARGARRPNSQLIAGTNPFCFGEFEVYEGKSAYSVGKTSISNYFRELTSDLSAVYTGFYFLEFAEYFCQENNDEKEMLKLLYQSLRALESPAYKNELVKLIFELKAITINGEGPTMFSCIHCRKKESLHYFSVRRGGVFCDDCATFADDGVALLDDTIYTMQYIVSSDISKLYRFGVSDEVLAELKDIIGKYIQYYVHHTFNSASFL